jgi:hypothetical protein
MSATPRSGELRDQMAKRAELVDENKVQPGAPTLVGLVAVLMNELAELKERVEILERNLPKD